MSDPAAVTVGIVCPGCKASFPAPGNAPRVTCPSCGQVVVFRKCLATGKTIPVLESWSTWTHPGCSIKHSVAKPGNARRVRMARRTSWVLGVILVLSGLGLVAGGIAVYREPPSATCNGQSMTPADTCTIVGGTNPGTFDYDQMLAQSSGGSVGVLVVMCCIGGVILVSGGILLNGSLRERRRKRAAASPQRPSLA